MLGGLSRFSYELVLGVHEPEDIGAVGRIQGVIPIEQRRHQAGGRLEHVVLALPQRNPLLHHPLGRQHRQILCEALPDLRQVRLEFVLLFDGDCQAQLAQVEARQAQLFHCVYPIPVQAQHRLLRPGPHIFNALGLLRPNLRATQDGQDIVVHVGEQSPQGSSLGLRESIFRLRIAQIFIQELHLSTDGLDPPQRQRVGLHKI
mmetsp:Transcript_27906/g.72215  ORF Transcript_27906/g.72215 Transcript_27906/m.72215 type:complete len:203 (-) Transcript_27906:626-1234(-)